MNPEPVATYRLQLRPGFGFEQATDIVDYLRDLGVSHLYTSPYLQAAAGSSHGYDIVDPSRVSDDLGGPEAHARLCETLLGAGLGHMIDVVPNHMAIAGRQNPWWWDVLENGPSSPYAAYFDVDWEASEERWPNKVLLPVLGDHYGRILEAGQLQLSHRQGHFSLHYQELTFPLDPSSLAEILNPAAASCGSGLLAFLAQSYHWLPRPTVTARQDAERRHRDKAVLFTLLRRLCREQPEVLGAIDAEVARLNQHPDALDALIERQNYRLACWRMASRDLGYRRFFDIKDLAGLRVEDREVFQATHALPILWVQKGWVQGLRIDHPDGLRDPTGYFHRLRKVCPGAWIVAEKILEPGETLPSDWPIAGTTGYEFLNHAGGIFIEPRAEWELTRLYRDFTGESGDFRTLARDCKRMVLAELLGSELNRLSSLFVAICERHRRHRDYTRQELRETLWETATGFPVYRSYLSPSAKAPGPEDTGFIETAIKTAMVERPDLDPELFGFLQNLLLLRISGSLESELAMRFQQLTGPAMAKGVEDTALYRFHRLVALNEVGGDPGRFGVSLEEFHAACVARQADHPLQLLASTTHDTKRSEDVRARLALLSERPRGWAEAVGRWAERNQKHRTGEYPDRNTEYLLYQTLVGAWPIDLPRIQSYMEKAVREAKVHTSWMSPNEKYEQGLEAFVEAILQDPDFCADLEGFVAGLIPPGRLNSLAQTLLKLTAPGVPDLYQGTELWDLSLVDPDNRRPVDFEMCRRLLAELPGLSAEQILARMDEGLPKLWIIRQALQLRHRHPEYFGPQGDYRPLYARGRKAGNLVAFLRGDGVLSLLPRLVLHLNGDWADTALTLPRGRWHNLLSGETWEGGTLRLQELLRRFPVGLLIREESRHG